jgi:hypothetical protein
MGPSIPRTKKEREIQPRSLAFLHSLGRVINQIHHFFANYPHVPAHHRNLTVEEEFPYPPPYSNFPLFCGSLAFPLLANTTISAPSLFSPDSGILHSAPLLGPKKLRTRPTGSYIPSQQLFTDSDSEPPPSPTYPHLSSPLLMLLGAPLSYLKGSRGAINLSGLVLCRPGLAWSFCVVRPFLWWLRLHRINSPSLMSSPSSQNVSFVSPNSPTNSSQ